MILFKRQKNNRQPIISRVGLFFYDRPRISIAIWLVIAAFGIASYSTLLKREGFPSVSVPYSLVNGAYLVNDASKVDSDIGQPLSKVITGVDSVKTVQVQSGSNFYTAAVQYEEGTNPEKGSAAVEKAVKAAGILPKQASAKYQPLSIGVNERGDDMLVSFYPTTGSQSAEKLFAKAQAAAEELSKNGALTLASRVEAIDPFVKGIDPATGKPAVSQKLFDRFGIRQNERNNFYQSQIIGIKGIEGFDALELDAQLNDALAGLNSSPKFAGYHAEISYSTAPDINGQINTLQKALLDGLAAVLVVSAILIALRASLITVSAMAMVLLATLSFLFLIGYSLNTITLFSLILCLSLIVDDTIIMVEAIDAQRRHTKRARETIQKATSKISRAMIAATLTATIGFAPLLFAGGILGAVVKAIPVTVIASLLISLLTALTFIPLLSRYFLLRPGQLGHGDSGNRESMAHRIEMLAAKYLSRPLLWSRHSSKRLFSLGIAALVVGLAFIVASGFIFQKHVSFNIFPDTKDANQLAVTLSFDPNQSIAQTQAIAERADEIVGQKLGVNFDRASYFETGTTETANLYINLLSFKKRDITAPQMTKQLNAAFKDFEGAQVKVGVIGVGPGESPFTVRIQTENRKAAYALAKDISIYLRSAELTRPDGTKARFKTVTIGNPDTISRHNGDEYVDVSAEFDGKDTSTLVELAQKDLKNKFNGQKLAAYGLKPSVLVFDLGTEGDFQNSFNKMVFAFPILLVAIYILLVTQFRSLLQPLLIFIAIPFSLFGITAGLWLTDNAFSFFTLLGFFALLGLSIKNTILLTDYANQARRSGASAVDAVAISLQERFRPLIATSLTAIVSLIPLYLSDPFWEGLTVTLMFGLLSSTFLVVTVFPYYYLGAEYLRLRISRRTFLYWLGVNIVLAVALNISGHTVFVPLLLLLTAIGWPAAAKIRSGI
ncbi:MAG TPA: efflux RND transporter permease subunit [Candidatus Saccharimonadales bacterium]|nr:efflux RND transporter permease subunit [Candidatus Saccharimonadales bacterium]